MVVEDNKLTPPKIIFSVTYLYLGTIDTGCDKMDQAFPFISHKKQTKPGNEVIHNTFGSQMLLRKGD